MKRRSVFTSIEVYVLCLVLAAAGTAHARTIELRGSNDQTGPAFTDLLTVGRSSIAPAVAFVPSRGASTLPHGVLGVADLATTSRQWQARGFASATPSRGPLAFDELRAASRPGNAQGAAGGAADDPRSSLRGGRETDVWVMLLVGLGVVLYQLRRKQRSLEQDAVAA
jgi:hypothetical protein